MLRTGKIHFGLTIEIIRRFLAVGKFELVSEYTPTGDQPQAIKKLVQGFKEGNQCQTLLGVTGSGKTFIDSISGNGIRPLL